MNAGIKKRNHKMLDYDQMRSKVKKLTEKPDKDPAKLPRTEKEQEMVSLSDFLREASPSGHSSIKRESSDSALSFSTNPDLVVPSPPKALNGIRERLGLGPEEDDMSTGTTDEDDGLAMPPPRGRRSRRTLLARTSSIFSSYSSLISSSEGASPCEGTTPQDEESFVEASEVRPSLEHRSISSIKHDNYMPRSSSIYSNTSRAILSSASSIRGSASTRGGTWPRPNRASSSHSTPWFEPSELEEIMAPLKVDFIRRQTDKLEQAKVAYDQLNEQLMSELPQLIDLRYVQLSHNEPFESRELTTMNHF